MDNISKNFWSVIITFSSYCHLNSLSHESLHTSVVADNNYIARQDVNF